MDKQANVDTAAQLKFFEHSLTMLETEAFTFSMMLIQDSNTRLMYGQNIKKMSNELKDAVRLGVLSPEQGAIKANFLRNQLLEVGRLKTSPLLRLFAEQMKKTGRPFEEIQNKKADQLFKQSFTTLNNLQIDEVHTAIIEASGKSNTVANTQAQIYGKYGKGLFIISIAIAIYEIVQAENKLREAAKHITLAAASAAGGYFVGNYVIAAGICTATMPVCAGIAIFAGALIVGISADFAFDGIF
ncbi:MAG: hypothetical protein Q4G54_00615 [Pelistega sp.]|nr:hypothetical protein [Pelistega sp.]